MPCGAMRKEPGMTPTEIVVASPAGLLMPAMSIEQAVQRRELMINYVKALLQEGVDYGKIPNATKPALLKAGAEKFATLFGLVPSFDILEHVADWMGADHEGEPFFYWHYRCVLRRGGEIVGEGNGSCNSWESKYRYRTAERVCPACGQATIIKGREEYGGGWVCFVKKGGCGAKFRDGETSIEEQQVGKIKNPDPADIVNTVDKIAQKRALVAAVLVTCNASEFFTQDVDDFYEAAAQWLEAAATESTPIIEGTAANHAEPAPDRASAAEGRRAITPPSPVTPEQPSSGRRGRNGSGAMAPTGQAAHTPARSESAPAPPAVFPAHLPQSPEIQEMVRRLKLLRAAERAAGHEPPPFTWDQKEGEGPLVREIRASRKRLYDLAKQRGVEITVPQAQILDDALFALLEVEVSLAAEAAA